MNAPQGEVMAVEFDSDRARELADQLKVPIEQAVRDYLHQFEDGPIELQEMVDRLEGVLIACEASVFAALMMAAPQLGVPLPTLASLSLNRLGVSIKAMVNQGSVQ